jgi:flagellar motor switch protein FliG
MLARMASATLTGPEKAVIFLLSLDEKIAGPIVAEMSEDELRKLRAVAATMREVPSEAVEETYRDFVYRSSKAVAVPRGGLPYLRRLAARALGEERARTVFEDGVTSPLARLESAQPDVIANLLTKEPPQLAAAVLARFDPKTAASVLVAMPPDRQAAIMARVSRLTELPASTLEEVANALTAELPVGDGSTTIGIDGMAKAAEILNLTPKEFALEVLVALENEDANLSQDLRLAMFTFTDLVRLDSRAMRALLREVPTDRLTLALKNSPDEVMSAVFSGLSSRAAEVIRDELELLSNPKKADVERARREIVETALRLEAEGVLDLGRGE